MNKPSDFQFGLRVLYVPGHAHGDLQHPDCEQGTVFSANERFVFVRFDKQVRKFGWDGTTSQSCDPEDLRFRQGDIVDPIRYVPPPPPYIEPAMSK